MCKSEDVAQALRVCGTHGWRAGGGKDSQSSTAKEAFGKAKEAEGIPTSQQPDKQRMTPDTQTGKPLRTYDFKNSKGERITIRRDNARKYGSPNEAGDQKPHYNSGKTGEKLKAHHNIN